MGERAQAREELHAERRSRRLRAFRRAAAASLVGLLGAGGTLLAGVTFPWAFRVELETGFGRGETVLALPPFGSLTADTHLAPVHLSAALKDVGVRRLTDVVNHQGPDGLVAEVERDAGRQVRSLALRALAVASLGGAALGVLVFRRRWSLVAASTLVALFAVGSSVGLARFTLRPAAFTEPQYSGSLSSCPKLIGPVREATDRIGDLRAGPADRRRHRARLHVAPVRSLRRTRSGFCTSPTSTPRSWG